MPSSQSNLLNTPGAGAGVPHFHRDDDLLCPLCEQPIPDERADEIQERIARVRDTMNIEDGRGRPAAKVHNALITPLRDRWQIDVPGGQNLSTQGNILNHEYRIERGRQTIATVSRKWFRIRDSYGVEVAPGEDAALMLAITVVIDMMAHAGR